MPLLPAVIVLISCRICITSLDLNTYKSMTTALTWYQQLQQTSNLTLSLISEQHNYATQSASLQHLTSKSFWIKVRRTLPNLTILGCDHWNDIPLHVSIILCNKSTRKPLKKHLHVTSFILFRITNYFNIVKYIWNNSYLYCGCRWMWRMIIAVNFPI